MMKPLDIYEHILPISAFDDPGIRPYQVTIQANGHTLSILGIEHTDNAQDPQLTIATTLIDRCDSSTSVLALEGGIQGALWEPILEHARERAMQVISIEPTQEVVIALVREKKIPDIDIAAWALLNTLMSPSTTHVPAVITALQKQFSLPGDAYAIIRQHIAHETQNESLLPEDKNKLDTIDQIVVREAQRPYHQGTSIQRAGEALNRARDTLMVVRIIELAATHDVIALMGLNHAICQEPAFRALGFSNQGK